MSDEARAAALNNAYWCDTMCRAHGIPTVFGAKVWAATTRSPMFYPDAVTLQPAVAAETVLQAIELSSPGATVKDSFADLDLSGHGFRVLIDAHWIRRDPAAVPTIDSAPPDADNWHRVTSGAGLAEWARSWGSDVFRPGLLADDSVHVLACRSDGGIVAGAVASVAAAVVGISNVFAVAGVDESTWAGVLRQVELLLPGIPVVGYEHGTDLTIAEQSGLRRTGPLRIWISDG